MDALLMGLIGTALAAFGGRWWQLAATAGDRLSPRDAALALLPGCILAAAVTAFLGNGIHAQMGGAGMDLFLALALVLAGLAMLWPLRPLPEKLRQSVRGPFSAATILLASLISDGALFLLLAIAARGGQTMLTATGGAAGLITAGYGAILTARSPIDPAITGRVRIASGIVLILVSAATAISALGLS